MSSYSVNRKDIGSGDEAIFETVKNMTRLARRDKNSPQIRKIAEKIFLKCGDKNELCMAEAGFNYVYKHIKYKFDDQNAANYLKGEDTSNIEFLTAPKFLADPANDEIFKEGDCDDMATMLCSIYLALGMRARLRIIAWKDNDFSHVYAEAGVHINDKGYWIPSDPVIKKFGIEKAPEIRVKSFEV